MGADTAPTPVPTSNPLKKYRILAELGRGGMASVFLAFTQGPNGANKLVVLKQLLPALASNPTLQQAFRDEARLAVRVNHPNVVQTYEISLNQGSEVLVMEYLEGQPLSNILARAAQPGAPPMPLAMRLRILVEALAGLHHAHELCDYDGKPLSLVHRDVSPQNLFVTYDGQVKLLDFGIAKAATSSTQTEGGIIKGKLYYMSPEQARGDPLDRRSDIFSVGILLWEAATGSKFWQDLPDMAILRRLSRGKIPSAREVQPSLAPALERILTKATDADATRRYATAQECIADLEAFLEDLHPQATPRAIGTYVSSLFEAERLAARQTIEGKLGGVMSGAAPDVDARVSLLSGAPSGPSTTKTYALPGPPSHASAASWLMRAILLALVLSSGWLLWGATRPAAIVPAAAPATSAAAPPASAAAPAPVAPTEAPAASASAAPAPRRVTVRIAASPPEARITLGDEILPNPSLRQFPEGIPPRALRIEARGYVERTAEVAFDRDTELQFSLVRRPQTPASSPPPSAPPPGKPACAQPFVIDERGIKTLRPECR